MLTLLLKSYKGPRLLDDAKKFETFYFSYGGQPKDESRSKGEWPGFFEDCSLFAESQGEINALWLVLHIKNKITTEQGKDPGFIQSRITFDSISHLLSYPWLSSVELAAALKLTLQRFKKGTLEKVLRRALERIMHNAFCVSDTAKYQLLQA